MNQIATFDRAETAAPARAAFDGRSPTRLPKLLTGEDLPIDDSEHLFERLVLGKLEPAEIAGMLIALRMKGETAEEMIGAAQALQRRGVAVRAARLSLRRLLRHRRRWSGLINVSTATAFVAAAAGCRSPSMATAASARAAARPTCSRRSARRSTSIRRTARRCSTRPASASCSRPLYHPGMKHAALVRRQLEVRTIMNLLGPCINPARPPVQLLGVADPKMLRRIAQTLDAMGVEEALVVHGSGLDEVALHGETRALAPVERRDRGARDRARRRRARARAAQACRPAAMWPRMPQRFERCSMVRRAGRRRYRRAQHRRAAPSRRARRRDLTRRRGAAREALRSGARGRVLDRFVEASHG